MLFFDIIRKRSVVVIVLLLSFGVLSVQGAAPIRVSGTVRTQAKEPVVGATVTLKDGNKGVITDSEGHFYIEVPSKESVLVFRYVGYFSQEVRVGNQININVYLKEEVTELEAAVVVGYGVQKKASVVGAIETIAPKQLQLGTNRSISNNLAGQLSGIIGVQRSGEPGNDNADIWIRGIATFKGNTSPLVLVDGVERSLDNIDPAEIESFSILKDASASAVYGVRGANGVIIINTKRGSIGKPQVNIRYEAAISQPTKLPEFVDAPTYMTIMNDIAKDAGKTVLPFTAEQISKTRSGYDPELYADVNWIDAITKDYASNQRVNVDVNGGSEILRYSLVASVFNEKGIMERDSQQSWDGSTKLTRYNVRTNVDVDITKTTQLRINIGGYMQQMNKANHDNADLFNVAFNTPPYVHPTIYSTGEIPIKDGNQNPWALATQTGFQRIYDTNLESFVSLDQDLKFITKGLRAKLLFSFDSYNRSYVIRGKNPTYYNAATGRDDDGHLILTPNSYGQEFLDYDLGADYGTKSTYLEFALSYNREFGDHSVDILGLYNQRNYDTGLKLPIRNQGFAGRFSYSYKMRYIGEFNFGYNGSENFAKGHRFGFFPSIAAGWYLSEEPFMKALKPVLSKVKFRVSYGLVGNDKLYQDSGSSSVSDDLRFAYITRLMESTGYAWGSNAEDVHVGRQEGFIGIPDLTWETSAKTNVGLELGFMDCINLNVDIFQEKRKDILIQRGTLPGSAGFIVDPWANYGSVENHGVELSLEMNKQFNKNWFGSFRGTFTYARSKITEMDEPIKVLNTYRSYTGKPVSTLSGLEAVGLFTEDDFEDVASGTLKAGIPVHTYATVRPGDIRYKDQNGDGAITDEDVMPIGGTEIPQIVYGFGGLIRYRNFEFVVFAQGVAQAYRVIGGDLFLPGSGAGVLGNIYSNYTDSWSVKNPSQDVFYPRFSDGPNLNNNQPSTWWKKNMSFLRIKTIELGYYLPESAMRKIGVSGARVFFSGNNLFCFSKFKLWDPELDTDNGLLYPPMRTFSAGLEFTF